MNYDVFISCKSEDYPLAKPIYDYLVECGLVVFLASVELRKSGVAVFGKVIDAALESAEHMIVFTSKAEYVTTTYVEDEWRTFDNEIRSGRKSGNIITVLKGVSVANLPIGLRKYQSFDYNDHRDLISYLPVKREGVIPPQPTPTPTPQPEPKPQPKPQPTPTVKTYKVGDLYDDGTKRGVVFEVTPDGRHGKIVSLEEAKMFWSNEMKETGATSRTDGMKNMQAVYKIEGWREKYPVFAWCAKLGEGWYLPAIEELSVLYKSVKTVNKEMERQGARRIRTAFFIIAFLWSSTTFDEFCVWYVDMRNGSADLVNKYDYNYVRAVAKF